MNRDERIWCSVIGNHKVINSFAEWEMDFLENIIYPYMSEFSRRPITSEGNEQLSQFMKFQFKRRDEAKEYYGENTNPIYCNVDLKFMLDGTDI